MRKNIKKVLLIIFAIVIFISQLNLVYAKTENVLTITTNLNKESYVTGDELLAEVKWSQGMQAMIFKLNYDADKIEFVKATISSDMYNSSTPGVISVSWADMSQTDQTKVVFTFKTIKEGTAEFSLKEPNFVDGSLDAPDSYDITKTAVSAKIVAKTEAESKTIEEGNIIEQTPNTIEQEQKTKTIEEGSVSEQISDTKGQTTIEISKEDTTKAPGKIPQTGLDTSAVIMMIIAASIGIMGYLGYKKLSDI